ncbi:hypothetical protein N1851_013367 [Merluccius polli]|uniref:DUF6729 domain-containing protein n=1 Tax=Merluccius polli TaxID=89951 RepID=A0AA47MVU7_MERPO|nr:hypothetical protein N1851_013367 [Merluccius polli]
MAPVPCVLEQPSDVADRDMVMAAEHVEEAIATQSRICLPAGWKPALPVLDQQWISKALFQWSKTGQPELDFTWVDRMWWYPPQPSLVPTGIPPMERYFGHPLFLWMPRKLWRMRLLCPHEDCGKDCRTAPESTTCGWCQHDILHGVRGCKRKVISWTRNIIRQLDIGHHVQFPCLLTSKLGCDMQVVRQMRQRGLGNSSSQLQRQMAEQHAEVWLQKQLQFLTDCSGFARAVSAGLVAPMAIGDTPKMMEVPKHRWLMQVYSQDVLGRLEEIKASITSLFGRVLKLDSTKKIVKKLAGEGCLTASWATNIGNEHGQVIMSVLTDSEGYGLGPMIGGLMSRYKDAGVPPPEVLYVDRDCCGSTHLRKIFGSWDRMLLRLDIWHFMRRIAIGCTTDSHSLYAGFMNRLSQCIFIWDEDDVRALTEAMRAELATRHILPSTPADVMRRISRAEMALHCRRTTRSRDEMEALITQLLEAYDGDRGCNTLGVPLIHSERMAEIWKAQTKHLCCLQDPPGVQLYMQTGTLQKGGAHSANLQMRQGVNISGEFPSPHEPVHPR